jgi:hypothetical protein
MVEASSEWQIRMNCQTSPHYVGAIYRDLTGLYMDALPIGHPPYFCIGARPLPSQRLFFQAQIRQRDRREQDDDREKHEYCIGLGLCATRVQMSPSVLIRIVAVGTFNVGRVVRATATVQDVDMRKRACIWPVSCPNLVFLSLVCTAPSLEAHS